MNRIKDYEFMWETLKESYPYFGVLKRKGIDVDKIYTENKSKISESHDDLEFFNAIKETLENFNKLGHLSIMDGLKYDFHKSVYIDIPFVKTWHNTLNDPGVCKFYKALPRDQNNILQNIIKNKHDNVTTEKILPNKIAYVKIQSFGSMLIEDDHKKLMDFYNEVSNYDNLIIDITDNDGGSDEYYEKNIVSPLINKPFSYSLYSGFKKSKNNLPFLNDRKLIETSKPVSKLPKFENVKEEDIKNLDFFNEYSDTINPSIDGIAFKGEIWTLINKKVYSASESYAYFCKATGFSKLVGRRTRGGLMGIDPGYIVLPHSKIMIIYSMSYGFNSDGSCNEEVGTVPDCNSSSDESILDTCLKIIK